MSKPLGSEGDPTLERALRTKTEETLVAPHSAAFMFDVLNEFFGADRNDISEVAPYKRGFSMVFQSLALFPHMSVAQNSAYGLKLRKASVQEQRVRVEEILTVFELPHIADRAVSELSGGHRQRVATARALAIQPKLFLLDEPLFALDAKLRDNIQIELRRLQQKLGIATVLVTHDQMEAMRLADEPVVMDHGIVQQAATPTDV